MGNKLNQQRVVKKWSLVYYKKHIHMYMHVCMYIEYISISIHTSMEWRDKVCLPLRAWQGALGVPGQETALILSCDILGSSLSQEMPSWPAADKIKSSKEGFRVFMSNSKPLWEISSNNCLYSVYSGKLILISSLVSYMPVTPLAFSQRYLKTWNLPCVLGKKKQKNKPSRNAWPLEESVVKTTPLCLL